MKTIGVLLSDAATMPGAWIKTEAGFSLDTGTAVLEMNASEAPLSQGGDHDLYSWVSLGERAKWVSTFGMTRAQRLSVLDLMATTSYTLHAHLVTAFAKDAPTLVLFGRNSEAFAQVELGQVMSQDRYNQEVRPHLFPSLRTTAAAAEGEATLSAQLIESDGRDSTRSGVMVYWESTGGYFVTQRTRTVNGVAQACLRDYAPGVKVKVGFKNYPAKAEVLL